MAVTHGLVQPWYVKSNVPGAQPLLKGDPNSTGYGCAEDSSQSWQIGDLIYHDNSDEGLLKICTAATEIAGQATRAAAGVKNTYVHFRPILQTDIYAMNVYHSTPASAITAMTMVGKVYAIITSGGKWFVDIENTTVEDGTHSTARVRVHSFVERHPATLAKMAIGDIYGMVYVTFLQSSTRTDGSSNIRILQYQ